MRFLLCEEYVQDNQRLSYMDRPGNYALLREVDKVCKVIEKEENKQKQ